MGRVLRVGREDVEDALDGLIDVMPDTTRSLG